MRTEYLDELGDTLLAVAIAGVIGLAAANLAVQVNKDRVAFDAAANSQRFAQTATQPAPAEVRGVPTEEPASQLNY